MKVFQNRSLRKILIHFCVLVSIIMSGCKKKDTSPDSSVSPNDFLSGNVYEKLVVEIQYVKGFQPAPATISNITSFLQLYLNKPAGVEILQNEIASPGKPSYTVEDIRNIESANRVHATSGKTLAAYFLFVDQDYASNSGSGKVLGMAYGRSSMVIFEKTVKDFSGGLTQPPAADLETTVAEHEFGHIVGLVNNGTSMQSPHQDVPNGKHCSDKNCLMYYTAETSDIVANILGGSIPTLDNACKQDLKSNGGK